MFNTFFLALSTSIDSLGIGITYGIKNTKISFLGNIILFIISFAVTHLSTLLGNTIIYFLSPSFNKLIGNGILIFMGLYILFQSFKNKTNNNTIFNNPVLADIDNSSIIDYKESIILAITLSLDSLCISIGGAFSKINLELFPLLVSSFQLCFLNLGIIIGKHINNYYNLPENIWSILSSILLLYIGFLKLII